MKINIDQATDYIIRCMKAKLTCMLSGHPGIGKSDVVKAIAEQFNLELIDERLGAYDPVYLNGMPKVGTIRSEFIPFKTFPLEIDSKIPKGKNGWLIFLDEFNSAPLSVQASAYRLVLDRAVGQFKLHPRAVIVCAGNLLSSGAIVNRIGTAMQSRLVHLELAVTPKAWLKWATLNNIDHRILAFIDHSPDSLYQFDPKHDDKTFSCPRTWSFLSSLIVPVATKDLADMLPLWAGTIGEGMASMFVAHTEMYTNLPTYQEILQDPLNARLDTEPAMLFGVSRMISGSLVKSEMDQAMKYIERLPVEFQTITLQNIMPKDKTIVKEKSVNRWLAKNGVDLL